MDNSKTKKNFGEPEEKVDFSKSNPGGEFDTLNTGEDVIQPAGSGPRIVGDTSKLNQPIGAANHQQESINLNGDGPIPGPGSSQPGGPDAGQTGPGGQPRPEEPFNPEFSKLPEDEQEQNAIVAADAIIEGYSNIKLVLPKLISIKDSKLKKMHKAGEININARIPVSRASVGTVSVIDFVHDFNNMLRAPFVTSPEFKDNVRPLLAHVLKGKGLAPTPEQMLMYYVGMDVIGTGIAVAQSVKQTNELLNELREFNAQNPGPTSPITVDVPSAAPYETHAAPPPPPPMDGNAAVTSQTPPPPPPPPAGDAMQALAHNSIRNAGKVKKNGKPKNKPGPKGNGKSKPRVRNKRSSVTVLTPVS